MLFYRTLAISAQLFPWSRICLSLSSSAGVHGVLVRLFFTGGVGTGAAAASSTAGGAAGAPTGGVT